MPYYFIYRSTDAVATCVASLLGIENEVKSLTYVNGVVIHRNQGCPCTLVLQVETDKPSTKKSENYPERLASRFRNKDNVTMCHCVSEKTRGRGGIWKTLIDG